MFAKRSGAGFEVVTLTYWNAVLFPFNAGSRLFSRRVRLHKRARSDLQMPPQVVNGMLSAVITLERKLIGALSLPVGLSVICVARKN